MMAAGLLARNAVARGLRSKPWVKTSTAPGSQVVTDYYEKAGLWPALNELGFNVVGYGCATCIGNSGPLPAEVSQAVNDADLAVVSVLSGNRNFEGRQGKGGRTHLVSPVVAAATAVRGALSAPGDLPPRPEATQDSSDIPTVPAIAPVSAAPEATVQ